MEETSPARPPESYFKARDLYDAALFYGDLRLTMAEGAVFRYLLENTWYQPGEDQRYGYVITNALGVESIAQMCCMSRATAERAMRGLRTRGMIRVAHGRSNHTGGSEAAAIEVAWLTQGYRPRRMPNPSG
jgi:hypothetical protein